jgi:regulator of sigma E protease
MFKALLAITLTLIFVVGIHEAGHALAARFFKVTIQRISIGFGRPLVQWRSSRGCEWVWAMWPLGGYVQLANTRIDKKISASVYFDKKPIGQRIIILLAGVTANLLTAWIAYIFVFYLGFYYKIPQIDTVQENSVASSAGMRTGDRFIAIAGHNTTSWQEVGEELIILWGEKDIKVTMAPPLTQQVKDITLDLSHVRFDNKAKSLLAGLGITANNTASREWMQAPTLLVAVDNANHAISHLSYFFIMILKQLISGIIPFSILLGPLGLFSASITSFSQGFVVFLYFIANLSLAVAFINVLPITGLDGGSVVYALIEKIRGTPVSIAMEVLLHRLMIIVAFVLLVHLLMNDLTRFLV